jgi:hypothetical protein
MPPPSPPSSLPLTSPSDNALASIVSLTKLQELNLSQCPFLNGTKIGSTVSHFTNLRKLDLGNCKTANDSTLANISVW